MLHFALLLPPVAERARAGVGGRVRGKFAIELGEQRDAVGEAKLGAGGGQCRVLSREASLLTFNCAPESMLIVTFVLPGCATIAVVTGFGG